MSFRTFGIASGAAIASCLLYMWQKQRLQGPILSLPPSLEAEWLVGHLRLMPSDNEHIHFAKIGKDLKSDIISFNVMGQTIIVLNSAIAAAELLEKRSSIYSDRPEVTMITDERLIDWRKTVSLCPSGPRHRTYRKMMQKFLSKGAATAYHPYQETEIHDFLKRILTSTKRVEDEFRRAAGAIILRATYGYHVQTTDDEFVVQARNTTTNLLQASLASNYLVNVIPVLKYIPSWMPGAQWKRQALEWRAQKNTMIDDTFNWTKHTIKEGTAEPSIVQTLLSDVSESAMGAEEAEDHIKHIAGTLFAAGFETTVSSFMGFVLAMTLYPNVQQKAQVEIDEVIGSNRLPNMQDQSSLPYVNAIIQEVLRWQPATPLGVPHRSVQDDIYGGYLIPKGSTV